MDSDLLLSPLNWHRGLRSVFDLSHDHGLYALFLRDGGKMNGITPGKEGLLYIGLAANRQGLKGRCHFNASTRNHSPRKSLAVLLMEELLLKPVLVVKPGSRNTWSLAPVSEQGLTAWMHDNLELAVFPCLDPEPLETELILRFAPPLNLTKCQQTEEHRRISAARSDVLTRLEVTDVPVSAARRTSQSSFTQRPVADKRVSSTPSWR